MITAIILAHNDEKIIERAIQSVRFCDEIIVIDDESTDRTAEKVHNVCKAIKFVKYKIYQRKLNNDFAAQRNFGLSKALGEWVLFVDSDEVVTAELSEEIKNIISMLNAKCQMLNGLYIKRRDYLFGKWLRHGETANVRLLRLARKDAGKWVRPVHEVWEVNGEVDELSSPLLHYPHQTITDFLAEVNSYSTLNAEYLFREKVQTNWLQIILWPAGKFIQNYIWRGGFLDSVPGFIVAMMMSLHSFLTRGKLYILWRDASNRSDLKDCFSGLAGSQ